MGGTKSKDPVQLPSTFPAPAYLARIFNWRIAPSN